MHRARVVLSVAFAVAVFALLHARAYAVTEYCPAVLENGHSLGGGVYSFVLSAASARTVHGTLLVDTNDGSYTIDFPNTNLVVFVERLHNSSTHRQRAVYVSQPLYVRFPTAVESISLWSVLSAQSTGDALFHWDARGMVTCKIPESVDHATYSSANSNVVSENPMPFDLTQ